MANRTKLINRSRKARRHVLIARRFHDYFSTWKNQPKTPATINVFQEFDKRLQALEENPDLLIHDASKMDQMKQLFARDRISTSTVIRVLSWQGKGISIFNHIVSSRVCRAVANPFEVETQQFIEATVAEWSESLELDFRVVGNCPYASRYYPFMMGTPDITIFSPTWRPLTFVECKQIESAKEFATHVQQDTRSGLFTLKPGSHYLKQVQGYLNVLLIESSFLVIRFSNRTYVFKVFRQAYKSEEVQRVIDFYLKFYLPLTILNRKPRVAKGSVKFFDADQTLELKNFAESKFSAMNFEKPGLLESYKPEFQEFELYFYKSVRQTEALPSVFDSGGV